MESTMYNNPTFESGKFTWHEETLPWGCSQGRGRASELNISPEHKTKSFVIKSEKTGKELVFTFDYNRSSTLYWNYSASFDNKICYVQIYNDVTQ